MEITGTIKRIADVFTAESGKFTKRDFVLEWSDNPLYPQQSTFTLVNKSVEFINKYKAGDTVKLHWNLKGRDNQTKNGMVAFNTLEVWRIEGSTTGQGVGVTSAPEKAYVKPVVAPADDNDLPF